jgi:hypothetical protein
MGMGEYDSDFCFEEAVDQFREDWEEKKKELSEKSDEKILNIAINCGRKLNNVTEYFPAYDVALKLKTKYWTPTFKQRQAIINVTSYFLTKQEYE